MTFDRLIDFRTLQVLLLIALAWTTVASVMFALTLAVRAAFHRYAQRDLRPDEPRCLKCRYIVKHVTTPFCPECGASLKRGVLLPRPQRPISPSTAAIILTFILVPGPLFTGFYVLGRLIPWCNQATYWVTGGRKVTYGVPNANPEEAITIKVDGCGNLFYFRGYVASVRIQFENEEYVAMTIEWSSRAYFVRHIGNSEGQLIPDKEEELINFLRRVFTRYDRRAGEAVADDVMMLMETVAAGRELDPHQFMHFLIGNRSCANRFQPLLLYSFVYFLASIFVMVVTGRFLARRIAARRVFRSPAVAVTSTTSP